MSDVVTALKMSNEGSGAGGGPSSPLDADQTAVDIEAGKDFVILESFILKWRLWVVRKPLFYPLNLS